LRAQAFSDSIAEYDKTMDIPDADMKVVKKKQVRQDLRARATRRVRQRASERERARARASEREREGEREERRDLFSALVRREESVCKGEIVCVCVRERGNQRVGIKERERAREREREREVRRVLGARAARRLWV